MYTKTYWQHENAADPVEIYSEINASGHEVRKVEIYRDGRSGFASSQGDFGGSHLSEGVMPSVDYINSLEEFKCESIAAEEFQAVWARALSS